MVERETGKRQVRDTGSAPTIIIIIIIIIIIMISILYHVLSTPPFFCPLL